MKRFTAIFVYAALVLASGCGPSSRGRIAARLDDVESYIDAHPDSALAVLRALDADSLRGPSQYARAALLHQVALDKCYIDITSDSVLSPAFWYLKHGTADQKLKTWYYRSVLARNAGDIDTRMSCLIRAEQYIPKAENPLMAGFVYTAKRVVFLHIYDLDAAVENAEKAVDSYTLAADRRRYFNAVIGLANIYNLQERYEESGQLIDTLRKYWTELSSSQINKAFGVELKYRIETHSDLRELSQYVEAYLAAVPPSLTEWSQVAWAYLQIGFTDDAQEALGKVDRETLSGDELLTFLMIRARLLRTVGQQNEADLCIEEYKVLMDERVSRALSTQARFEEDEVALMEANSIRNRWIIVLAVIVVSLILLALHYNWRHRHQIKATARLQGLLDKTTKQLSSLTNKVRVAEREAQRWKELLQKDHLPPEMTQLISDRVEALNRYAFALASGKDNKQALCELEASLAHDQPEQFLSDLVLQYRFLHPGLNSLFDRHHLSDQEKMCCTLLTMGCKIKEISSLTGLSEQRCYNIFSLVRRKMDFKKETKNLQTLLQEFVINN